MKPKEDFSMSKGTSVLSLILAGSMVLGPALAFAQGGGTGTGRTSGSSSTPTSPSASSMTGDYTGRHTMTGQVTKIDPKTGKFSLKTGEGTLDLHAPASALAGVKKGDRMSVEIAVKPMK
jgi:hypothetical protein